MSHPILYSPTETKFDHNGIGILGDCILCVVTEEANGAFELEMKYPMDGIHYSDIIGRSLIKAKPNQEADPQLFRVYGFSKPMNGIVSVYAEHISYDLSGIPVGCFSAENASNAMSGLLENAVIDCPFTFMTDKATSANFKVDIPGSIRSKLGGVEGSILDVYGGEYEFDNYNVILHNSRGRNRGVSIRYGKNLTDIKQEENCAAVYTGVYPYWYGTVDESPVLVELPEKIVDVDGSFSFVKIKMLDLSAYFIEQPTEEQVRTYTQSYIKNNNIGVPSVSLTVSFKQLEQSEEYKGMALLEKVSLFDTVNVEFPMLGVSANAKAVKIIYNVLLDRVESITIGSVKSNIAGTIASQQQQISQTPTRTEVQRASAAATAWLTNGKGYKVERRDENGNTIDTLYMDTQDINTAVNVLRIGQSGIGFSQNGVDGPYNSAWTLDGVFNASFIKAGAISSESEIFFEPGFEEAETILKHSAGTSEIPDSDLLKYDFNNDGVVDSKDATLCLQAASGIISLSSWSGAVKTTAKVTIDVSKPNKAILISGTNMWGRTIEKWYGLDGSNNGKFHGTVTVSERVVLGKEIFEISVSDGSPQFGINGDVKTLSWKDNGDGTFILIGS